MAVRFCRECGARMTDTDKFCFNCGTPVNPPVQAPVMPPVQAPAYSPAPVPAEPTPVPVAPVYEEPTPLPVAPEVTAVPEDPVILYSSVVMRSPVPEQTYHPLQQPLYQAPQAPVYPDLQQPGFQSIREPIQAGTQQPPYTPPVYTPPADPFADLNFPVPEPPAPSKAKKAPKAPKPPKEQKISAPVKPLPKRSALNIIGSVLVCILLVALILPTVLLADVRMLAQEERVLTVLKSVDLDDIPAKDIFYDIHDDRSMLDWACQWMNKNLSDTFQSADYHWEDLTPKTVNAFLKETTVLPLTADTLAGLLQDVINGTSKTALEAEDIEEFLEENSEFLEEELALMLDRSSRADMAAQTMSLLETDELSLDSLPASPALEIAGSALSLVTLILVGVVAALLVVLLFIISRKYVMAGVHDTGLVMLIAGILLLALTGAARLMYIFGAGKQGIVYLIGLLAGALLESGLLISVCIFAFGILLLLIAGITRSVLKKRAAKA